MSPMRWLTVALLVFAVAQLAILGVRRAVTGSLDLAAPYAGSIAVAEGDNPYDPASLGQILVRAGREADADPPFTPALYPPATFVVLAPLALLDWPAARIAWLLANLMLLGFAVRGLVRLAGEETPAPLVGGISLALAPWATGIALGQPAIASVTLLVIALDRLQQQKLVSSGILLGASLMLKPQLAGLFVLYHLLSAPKRPAIIAAAMYVASTLIVLALLESRDIPWLTSWRANSALELNGGYIDPLGRFSAQMVDLRPLLASLTGTRPPMWIGVAAALTGFFALLLLTGKEGRNDPLLSWSILAVLTLFAGYHRFYDAALLCIPATWGVAHLRDHPRRYSVAALACIVPFVVSGAWTLQRLGHEGRLGSIDTRSFLWNALVLRHQVWTVVALAVALFLALRRYPLKMRGSENAAGSEASD